MGIEGAKSGDSMKIVMKVVLKLLVFSVSLGLWILIIGKTGVDRDYLYELAVILNVLFFIIYAARTFKKSMLIVLFITVSVSFTHFAGMRFERHLVNEKLDSFDLDGDGIFGEWEQTEEQQQFFKRAINDTNVLFRHIVAIPGAFIAAIFGTIVINVTRRIRSKARNGVINN